MGRRTLLKKLVKVQLPYWEYRAQQTLTNPEDVALNIPPNASIIELASESDVCYFELGGGAADANSGGYIPAGGRELLGPLATVTLDLGIRVHAPAAIVHVLYFREG